MTKMSRKDFRMTVYCPEIKENRNYTKVVELYQDYLGAFIDLEKVSS